MTSDDVAVEWLVDALVMSPMSNFVGTDMRPVNATARALLPLIREAQAEAWDDGYVSGHSRAMRKMSDEPNVAPGTNPYRKEQS